MQIKKNPFQECPVYETKQFIFRLVEENDAEDLLECYSDPKSAGIFNSDNCNCDFVFKTSEEIKKYIKFWLAEYKMQYYVRFSIVEKESNKAIGTIEIFVKKEIFEDIGRVGLLRLDLASYYEREEYINEILVMIEDNFFEDFEVDNLITKAIPKATSRIAALKSNNYRAIENNAIVPYEHYFMKSKSI